MAEGADIENLTYAYTMGVDKEEISSWTWPE